MSGLAATPAIIGFAFKEGLRRRTFAVVLLLSVAFLALYGVAAHFAFQDVDRFAGGDADIIDSTAFTGATMFGLAMFGILFLGAVLAVFLTLGVVRGDAETGMLQPLVVRPIGRTAMLLSRFTGAALVSASYVVVLFGAALVLTRVLGDWSPDQVLGPAFALALGVTIIAAASLLASVFLSATAQGIAVFMLFGAGLVGGLIAQIGRALDSGSLESIGQAASWALPFEALYADGLAALTSSTTGLTGVVIQLGPFGGADEGGPLLIAFAIAYGIVLLAIASVAFARRDL